MSSVTRATKAVASMKRLVAIGVIAATAAIGVGTSYAATMTDLDIARNDTTIVVSETDATVAMNDLLRHELKTIATTDFSKVHESMAATTIRNMAREALKYSPKPARETAIGKSIETLVIKSGMAKADEIVSSLRKFGNDRIAALYDDAESLAVARNRMEADFARTIAGLENNLLVKELKRLANDTKAPSVLLQQAARDALLKDGVKPSDLSKSGIDPVAEFEKVAATKIETLSIVTDSIERFRKSPNGTSAKDAAALREVLAQTVGEGLVERTAAERLALEAISANALVFQNANVDGDRLATLIGKSIAAQAALETIYDALGNGGSFADLDAIRDYAAKATVAINAERNGQHDEHEYHAEVRI
jgi:hypothetical protein